MKTKEEDVNSVLNFKKKERHRCNLPWVRPLTSHIFLIFAIVKGNFVIHSLLFKSEHKYYDVLLHLFSDLSIGAAAGEVKSQYSFFYFDSRKQELFSSEYYLCNFFSDL